MGEAEEALTLGLGTVGDGTEKGWDREVGSGG